MPTQRMVLSLAIAIGGVAGALAPASSQENRGTWEQQMACTPDVWRLCSDQVPDVGRIVACLRRAVFETNAEQQQANRGPTQRGPQQTGPRSRAPQQVQPQAVQPRPRPYYEEDE